MMEFLKDSKIHASMIGERTLVDMGRTRFPRWTLVVRVSNIFERYVSNRRLAHFQ